MENNIQSCFIDESGDFGPYDFHSPYYLVTMVLHAQKNPIKNEIIEMESRAANLGWGNHAIHTGPLIRRESVYINNLMEERKRLFNLLFYFSLKVPVSYIFAKVNKSECVDEMDQTAKLSKEISKEIQKNIDFWYSFNKINIYYDNGQTQLTKIITSVFNTLFSNVEMKKVRPVVDYKLFQVADLLCTMEMLNCKAEHNNFSHSEIEFFENTRLFKKNYYKKLLKKRLPQST